jgi:hypothetical protein
VHYDIPSGTKNFLCFGTSGLSMPLTAAEFVTDIVSNPMQYRGLQVSADDRNAKGVLISVVSCVFVLRWPSVDVVTSGPSCTSVNRAQWLSDCLMWGCPPEPRGSGIFVPFFGTLVVTTFYWGNNNQIASHSIHIRTNAYKIKKP